jgi:hypothetical protein
MVHDPRCRRTGSGVSVSIGDGNRDHNRPPEGSGCACGPRLQQVRTCLSPLEGDGFEPSVPGTKEPVFVAEGELRGPNGGPKRVVSHTVPMVRIHLPPAASRVRT